VAGGVIVSLLVLGVATAIVIILIVLLLRRRQAGEKKIYSGGSEHYEREMQSSVGSVNGKSINLMPVGDTKDDTYVNSSIIIMIIKVTQNYNNIYSPFLVLNIPMKSPMGAREGQLPAAIALADTQCRLDK
jgi:hypothetical protein